MPASDESRSTETPPAGAPPAGAPRVVVGVTGASGALYAHRLVSELLTRDVEVHLVASSAARQVIREEIPELAAPASEIFAGLPPGRLRVFNEKDFFAPFCSGTFAVRAVVIVPATMGTIGAIAAGYVANSIHRAADVALKEGTRLVLVPRETPFSTIHLENLLRLSRAGATVVPANPAFYQKPQSIDDIIDFVVSRVLDQIGIANNLFPRWQEGVDS
jgi:4-hydroxy-3-polyprenylbenzoate decarboxylase